MIYFSRETMLQLAIFHVGKSILLSILVVIRPFLSVSLLTTRERKERQTMTAMIASWQVGTQVRFHSQPLDAVLYDRDYSASTFVSVERTVIRGDNNPTETLVKMTQ